MVKDFGNLSLALYFIVSESSDNCNHLKVGIIKCLPCERVILS